MSPRRDWGRDAVVAVIAESVCLPITNERLEQLTGLSRRSVQRAVQRAARDGMITVERRAGHVNTYLLADGVSPPKLLPGVS